MQKYGNHICAQSWGGYIVAGINASVTEKDGGSVTVSVTGKAGFYWIDGWSYAEIATSGGGSYKGAITGGSGSEPDIVDSAQSASKSFTVNKGHSASTYTATVTVKVSGETSSVTKQLTIPAKTSYAVKYNANGGSGAPAQQTKWYGENLTLQSGVPTRAGYEFKGWNTKADGTGTNYSAGASYTGNATITLYAQWEAQGAAYIAHGLEYKRAVSFISTEDDWKHAIPYISTEDGWKETTF